MPRKATQPKSTKNSDKNTENNVTETQVTEKPVPEKTEEKVPKKSKASAKKVKDTVDTVVPTTNEPDLSDVEDGETSSDKKARQVPTKETVTSGFEELVSLVDEEIERLRDSQQKSKGIKFLRTLGKKVKTLQSHSSRVMKQKTKTNRKNNTNSGFLKPVKISSEMAKFTGWKPEDLKSRVDVTKFICNYIREHKLQNPEDRRQIVADKKLSKLLDYNEGDKPLTYYRIQTYMKKHFTNPDAAPAK